MLVGGRADRAAARAVRRPRGEPSRRAEAAIERMRFATGVDDDLRPFHERFRDDPVIGRAVRAHPHLRVRRRPAPWEALAWAITEQLIELERAVRDPAPADRARSGRRCPHSGLRDMPAAGARSPRSRPAELEAFDLAANARAGAAPRGARGRRGPRRPRRPRARRGRGCWRSPTIGPLDARDARAPRPRATTTSSRPATSAIIKLVGRLTHRQPEGARRRGRGARVLRALRRVEGAGGRVPAPRGRRRAAHGVARRPGSSPSPGRNSLVSARSASGGRLSSLFCVHPAP